MGDLLPCPFCGSPCPEYQMAYGIRCRACDASVPCMGDNYAPWNRRTLPSATQAGGENQALRAMIRVNMLRYGPADLTHEDIDRQIEAAIAAFAPLPPAPEASAQREEARKG